MPSRAKTSIPAAVLRRLIALVVVMIPFVGNSISRYGGGYGEINGMAQIVSKVAKTCTGEDASTDVKYTYQGPQGEEQKMAHRIIARLSSFKTVKTAMQGMIIKVGATAPGCPPKSGGCSRSGSKTIELATAGDGQAWNSLPHEIGHELQNSFGGRYKQSVPSCNITMYCKTNQEGTRGEEFAEVFAAYVFAPGLLKQRCGPAYEFMKKNVFDNYENIGQCEYTASSGMVQGPKWGPKVDPESKPAVASPTSFSNFSSTDTGGGGSFLNGGIGTGIMGSLGQLMPVGLQIWMQMQQQKEQKEFEKKLRQQYEDNSNAISEAAEDANTPENTQGTEPVTADPGAQAVPSYSPNAIAPGN